MSREKISKVAINLFSNFGIKGVSMSQIAGALQISKKTLYAEFENKEELLSTCLEYEKKRIIKILSKTRKEASNPIELIILTITDMYHYKSSFCPAFFRDIQYFDEPNDRMTTALADLHQRYMMYFNQGIEEGYFIPNFEYEAIAALFVDQLTNWNNTQQPYIILAFLRGICTPKGMETLDELGYTSQNKE